MLKIEQLSHSYGDTRIEFADWEVATGDHAMILGASGSGKTTLLHLIGGLMKPQNGKILIERNNIATMSGSVLDQFRGANIGIVFQKPHLVRSLTVIENLQLAQMLARKPKDQDGLISVLESLGIEDLSNRKIHQLSQGQAQRVAIGRAVINASKLLLADEPTASLDDTNCEKVVRMLKNQAELHGTTLVVATHDQRIKGEFKNQLDL